VQARRKSSCDRAHLDRASRGRALRGRALLGTAVILASCAGAGAAGAAGRGQQAPSDPGKPVASPRGAGEAASFVSEVLDSGVRVYIEHRRGGDTVAVSAAWKGGLRAESADHGGAHRLLARVLPRGCGGRDRLEMQAAMHELEASITGFAGRDVFGLHGSWPSRRFAEGLELFADCVIAPRLDTLEVYRERERLQDELRAGERDPAYQALRTLASHVFGDHPYGRDSRGSPESVDRLTRSVLASLYRERYPPSALSLAIVGPVDPDEVLARVKALLGEAPRTPGPEHVEMELAPRPAQGGGEEIYRFVDADQAMVAFGTRGVGIAAPDRHAQEVLATILGGTGGRLAAALRAEGVAAQDHGAVASEALDAGLLAVYVVAEPEARSAAYRAVERAIGELIAEPPSAAELSAAKAYLVRTHLAARARPPSRAAAIALHGALGLEHARIDAYAELVEAVTAEKVRQLAATYLAAGASVRVTVMPMDLSPEAARRARGDVRGEDPGP
jgi:zinc protease